MNITNTLQTTSVMLPFMPCVTYTYVYLVTFISLCYDLFHKLRISSDLLWSIWKIATFFNTLVKWALSFNLHRWQRLICKKSEGSVSKGWWYGDSDSDKSSTYNSYPCKHTQSTCEFFSCKVDIFLWMRYYVWVRPYYIKKWIILMFFSHIIHLNTLTNRAT